ncbi:MAG: glycerate kinase [Melioribacteraceae bacterium]
MENKKFNILIAPNSFKECADSVEISEYIKTSLFRLLPDEIRSQINFDLKPISDGGDGFLQVAQRNFGLEFLHFEITYPYSDDKFFCPVAFSEQTKTLYVETAEVLGLKLIPTELRNPMHLSSKGMGDLLIHINDSVENSVLPIEKVVIGVGGTAINDLGLGMLQTVGWKFFDDDENEVDPIPANFSKIKGFEGEKIEVPFKIELIVDVDNPLIGDQGASLMFSLQKGASEEEAEEMDKGFQDVLAVLGISEKKIDLLNGSGGGLTAAFELFFDVEVKYAPDFIVDELKIHDTINNNYDLVVTGEGQLDSKSLMNKGAMLVVNEFAEKEVPIYLVCGQTEGDLPAVENLHVIEVAEYFNSEEESIQKIDKGIEMACKKIGKDVIKLFAAKNSDK